MTPVQFYPDAVVRLIREQQPVTTNEVRFAFSWPSGVFAKEALLMTAEITGELSHIDVGESTYWSAKTDDSGDDQRDPHDD